MTEKLPWMPFYGSDFYNDEAVRLMTPAEEAVYIRLLWWQWREGSIPGDQADLGQLVGSPVTDRVFARFPTAPNSPDRRQNPRLEEVRKWHDTLRKKRSRAGKAGRQKQLEDQANDGQNPGKSRANDGQTAGIPDTRNKKDKITWLTPFATSWESRCGNPPHGRLAKALAPLAKTLGEPETLRRFTRYLADNEPRYCSPERFAATHHQYGMPEIEERTDDYGRMVKHRKNPTTGEWEPIVA